MIDILLPIVGVVVGVFVGWLSFRLLTSKKIKQAHVESKKIKEEAKLEAKVIKKEAEIEAKENWYKRKANLEKEIEERKKELRKIESNYNQRISNIDERLSKLDRREQSISDRERHLQNKQEKMDDEKIANEWFMFSLVYEIKQSGLNLTAGKLYGYKLPPVLGGEYKADNFTLISVTEHFSFSGDLHEKIKDLPDGTPINIEVK